MCINLTSFWLYLFCLLSQLHQKVKKKIQATENNCIYFCLQLEKMANISYEEFKTLNWLLLSKIIKQCINSIVFKYFNGHCSNYLNEVFERVAKNNIETRGSFQKLKWSFCKTNTVKLHFVKPYGTTTDTRKQNLYLSFLNDSFMCMIPLLLMDHNKQFYLCIVLFCLRSKCCIFDNNDLI